MRYPNTHSASEIRNWHVEEEYEPGKWRPARGCECRSGGLLRRFKIAWSVFIGKRDAIHRGKQSGEWTNSQVNYRDITHTQFRKS